MALTSPCSTDRPESCCLVGVPYDFLVRLRSYAVGTVNAGQTLVLRAVKQLGATVSLFSRGRAIGVSTTAVTSTAASMIQ